MKLNGDSVRIPEKGARLVLQRVNRDLAGVLEILLFKSPAVQCQTEMFFSHCDVGF